MRLRTLIAAAAAGAVIAAPIAVAAYTGAHTVDAGRKWTPPTVTVDAGRKWTGPTVTVAPASVTWGVAPASVTWDAVPAKAPNPALTARPSLAGVHTHHCKIHFGGGTVDTTLITSSGTGGYGTVTVSTFNGVPRTVYFDADRIQDGNGDVWHGVTGSVPYLGTADPWAAYRVLLPNAVFFIQMHDGRGNSGWDTCPLD